MVAAFSFVVSGLNFLVQTHPLCASTVCFPGASGDRFGAKEAATSSNQIDGKDMYSLQQPPQQQQQQRQLCHDLDLADEQLYRQ